MHETADLPLEKDHQNGFYHPVLRKDLLLHHLLLKLQILHQELCSILNM